MKTTCAKRYARCHVIKIKGEKNIKKSHDYTILRQVFDVARGGGGDERLDHRG